MRFADFFVNLFDGLAPELIVFLLAMMPITELRASIPIGILIYELPVWSAFLWSVLGDIIPAYLILWLIGPISEWLTKHSKLFAKFFSWWFDRVHKNFFTKFQKYGALALALFVAIPLPVTGAWTGAAAAWLLKIPKKQAAIYISIGVVTAGLIVTGITTGALKAVSFF